MSDDSNENGADHSSFIHKNTLDNGSAIGTFYLWQQWYKDKDDDDLAYTSSGRCDNVINSNKNFSVGEDEDENYNRYII